MKGTLKKRSILFFCVLLSAILVFGNTLAVSATGNTWYDKYATLENNIGGSCYNSTDSGTLAWGEGYISDSYLDLYEVTKNNSWLDKFITHTDTVISNANDIDGDGYLGWETYNYTNQLAVNGGFESYVTGDVLTPVNWTRWQGTSSNLYRYTSPDPYKEAAALCTISRSDGAWSWMTQSFTNYNPDVRHSFRFYARVNSSASEGRAWIRDETTSTILASVVIDGNTSWQFFNIDFTTPAAGHTLKIYLGLNSVTSGQAAYFDDVSVSPYFGFVVHDGRIGNYMSKYVRLIYENPSTFPDGTTYKTKANTYKSFIENNLRQRWENSPYYGNCWVSVSSTEGYYKWSAIKNVNGNPNEILPYNMMLPFAEMYLNMYKVNGDATYLDRANKMLQYWKSRCTLSGTAYQWKYADTADSRIEDVSHGQLDVGAAITAFRDGEIMNGTDMERFTDTLTEKLWHPSATPPYVSFLIDGTGNAGSTRVLGNWMEMPQFDWDTWWIGADQYRNHTPSYSYELNVLSQIMQWDPQKLVNQGFEFKSSTDGAKPARWNYGAGATTSTIYQDTGNKYEGTYGLAIHENDSSNNYVFATQQDWSPSTSYTCEFWAKTDGGTAGGRVEIKNDTTGIVLGYYEFTNTSWQHYSFTFTSPSNTTNKMRTFLKNKNIGTSFSGIAYIDNIKIRKTSDSW